MALDKALLVLDLDETLVHATKRELASGSAVFLDPYHVYVRPHFETFKERVLESYKVAVWTAGSEAYAAAITDMLFENDTLEFVWSRSRCTRRFDEYANDHYWLKDLRKCKKKGYALERLLMVDNTPRKLNRNYGNLIHVNSFYGETLDTELLRLAEYLDVISNHENFRTLEKRGWGIV